MSRRSTLGGIGRGLLVLAALAAIGAWATSCGGGMPEDAVATVDGSPISKAVLAHWTSVEFVTDYDQRAQQPVPPGVIPDPPRFTACSAYLRKLDAKEGTRAQTPEALKHECEQHYRVVRDHVLNVLIVFEWYLHMAKEEGLKLSDKEVKEAYARFSRERFPGPGELQAYLAHTGESMSDEWLRMKIDLVSTKVNTKEIARLGGIKTTAQQRRFERWSAQGTRKWLEKTECRKSFVVQNCKQYKGPLAPDTRI